MAAYALTKAGAKVVMLEAGPKWFASHDSKMLTPAYATPHRGASIHGRPFGEFDACDGGWEIDGEPYTKAPGTQFSWWRARMLGGRTNHWGRISLRFGPDDFRGKSIDGLGDDWPISYEDVKPYYDNVDRLIGLYGSNEGLRNHPDGIFQPPPKPRCHELLVKKASDKLNITCIPARLSIITKPLNGRQACHYCGQCNRGCQGSGGSPGLAVFQAQGCGGCHTFKAANAAGTVGPDLDKVKADAAKAHRGSVMQYINESIVDPGAYVVPGFPNAMPPVYKAQIPPDKLKQLVQYLEENAK